MDDASSSALELVDGFMDALVNEKTGLLEDIEELVIVYRTKRDGVLFQVSEESSLREVGSMCSAVHVACVKDALSEPLH